MTIDGVDKTWCGGKMAYPDQQHQTHRKPGNTREGCLSFTKIIYLIFNEGYKASYGPERLIREELCEALLLCKRNYWNAASV